MTQGRLIAVVGPSGVGKDSVMQGVKEALPQTHLVRRVITRAPELGGEEFDPVSVDDFHAMAKDGAFIVHWGAHGLYYGIPITVRYHLNKGIDCLANFSRKALLAGADTFPRFSVLNITASRETLQSRLAARNRETPDDIARRLAEAHKPLPLGLSVMNVSNDGELSKTIACALAALQPQSV